MKKAIRIDFEVYSKLSEKKAQLIREVEGKNITFSDVIRRYIDEPRHE